MMQNNAFSNIIRYASCWEDTENLLLSAELENKICVSIISGGDNTLSLLTKNPQKIYAIDLNKTQICVFRLKISAFKMLSYDKLLGFLGVLPCKNRINIFHSIDLDRKTKDYFLKNIHVIENGVIHAGKFENYFHIFRNKIVPLFTSKKKFSEFASLDNISEQKKFYVKYLDNVRLKLIFKLFFGAKAMGKFGRDKSFYKYVDEENSQSGDIKKRFEFGISNTVNKTNPYLNYIANGNYTMDSLPHYLKKENYDVIRSRLDRIKILNTNISGLENIQADFFNLSDIFEYMSEEDFHENINILKSISNSNAVLAYYNMQNKRYISDSAFMLDKEFSEKLFKQNKSYFYRDFLIYRKGGFREQNR